MFFVFVKEKHDFSLFSLVGTQMEAGIKVWCCIGIVWINLLIKQLNYDQNEGNIQS